MESEHGKSSFSSPLIQISDVSGFNIREKIISKQDGINREDMIEEVKKQLWLAGPLIFESLFVYCLQVISVVFVGHLVEVALSSAALASSFASVTGFNLLEWHVLWILFVASHMGSSNIKCWAYTCKEPCSAMFIISLISIPLALVILASMRP